MSFLDLAAGVKIGQLGTPADTVRYGTILVDDAGKPLTGDATYVVTVPGGLHEPEGYFSVTLYGTDNKLLIPNERRIYDRTTFSAEPNDGRHVHDHLEPERRREERNPDREGLLWRAPSLRAEPRCDHEGVREEAVGGTVLT